MENELYHHGVLGMKWGVHRATRYGNRAGVLQQKAYKYDAKAAKKSKIAEKKHSKYDLQLANKKATKSARLAKRSATISKKATLELDDYKKSQLQSKAAKLDYKSKKLNREADVISKTRGYSVRPMKYVMASNRMKTKASKVRYKMAKDKRYIEMMKKQVASIPKDQLNSGYAFTKKILEL